MNDRQSTKLKPLILMEVNLPKFFQVLPPLPQTFLLYKQYVCSINLYVLFTYYLSCVLDQAMQ